MTDLSTLAVYSALGDAYRHFNEALFGGTLPDCVVTLVYARTARGYFRPGAFRPSGEDHEPGEELGAVDEVALNPFFFAGRTDREILSTLVHEQVHLWQQHYGKPPKRPVHNVEWGKKMDEVGLTPTATGEPGGKRTGRRVTHCIVDGGPYDEAFSSLNLAIDWTGILPAKKEKKERAKKVTYQCPGCEEKVRGREGLSLHCNECDADMEMPD